MNNKFFCTLFLTFCVITSCCAAVRNLQFLNRSPINTCESPSCHENDGILYPHENPRWLWKCEPEPDCENGENCPLEAHEFYCDDQMYFIYQEQKCGPCEDWDNACNVDPIDCSDFKLKTNKYH